MTPKLGYFRTLAAAAFGRLGVKASAVGTIIVRNIVGRPAWPERDFTKLSKEGYQQNAIVYACISLIARSVADLPWVVYEGKGPKRKEIEEHPLLDLLERPNPMQDKVAFLTALVAHRCIAGNAYVERTNEKKLERMELYAHRPDRMKIIPGPEGWPLPMAYEYTVNGAPRRFEVDPDGGQMPILHLKSFNPIDDWYGQSPLDAVAWAIDIYNIGSAHNKAILENGGSPSGALVFEGNAEGGNLLSEESYEETLRILRGEKRGYDSSGARMFLQGGKHSWLQFGLDPEKLQFIEGMHRAAREIAFALGVPPELVGIPGDKTYANFAEARQSFYQETVIPLARELARAFTHWMGPILGKNVFIEINTDDLDALQPMRDLQWKRIEASTILTLNEKRDALGYEQADGGDQHYEAAGKLPLGSAAAIAGGAADGEGIPPKKKPNGKPPAEKGDDYEHLVH